jgi:hypothetical protein
MDNQMLVVAFGLGVVVGAFVTVLTAVIYTIVSEE